MHVFSASGHRFSSRFLFMAMCAFVEVPGALYFIIPSLVFFRIFNFLVRNFVSIPKSLQGCSRKQWIYHNTVVSLAHSCVSSCLALYCFYDEPAMLTDMIHTWTKLTFYVVCFSAGYFIHDFVEVLLHDLRNSPGLLFHHVLSCMACSFTAFSQLYLAFPTGCLILEVNSVPLHLRRLMRYHQVDRSSLLYRFNVSVLFITFVIFRFVPTAWMEIIVIFHARDQYLPYYLFGLFGLGGMIIVNVVLFLSLCRAEFGSKTT